MERVRRKGLKPSEGEGRAGGKIISECLRVHCGRGWVRGRREILSRFGSWSPQWGEPVNEALNRRCDQASSTRYGIGYARTTGRRDGSSAGGWIFSADMGCDEI